MCARRMYWSYRLHTVLLTRDKQIPPCPINQTAQMLDCPRLASFLLSVSHCYPITRVFGTVTDHRSSILYHTHAVEQEHACRVEVCPIKIHVPGTPHKSDFGIADSLNLASLALNFWEYAFPKPDLWGVLRTQILWDRPLLYMCAPVHLHVYDAVLVTIVGWWAFSMTAMYIAKF